MKANRVLVPLDDSDFSLNVLPHVTRLLEPDRNEIFLLHVATAPDAIMIDEHVVVYADHATASVKAEGLMSLAPYVMSLEELGYQVTPLVSFGDPANEIERIAEEKEMDLIAMATHGRTGMARMLRGSVAQHVANHAGVPVLLFRVPAEGDGTALGA